MKVDRRLAQQRSTVRARVPLRLGLAGGGTDLPPYSEAFGGAVLNATIDRYAYAFIERSVDGRTHFVAPDLGVEESLPADLSSADLCRLQLHAGVARRMVGQFGGGVRPPLRVTSYVDAPAGSGLGSSSALVVALVEAFTTFLEAPLGPYDVARIAYEVERLELGLAGGKQDQYAATFGGTNFIEFLAGGRVIVNPLRVAVAVLNEFQTSIVICFTGLSRRSEAIIAEQQRRMASPAGDMLEHLHQLKHDAVDMKEALLRGRVLDMAEILNRSWTAKKRTADGISTPEIERLYEVALRSGATGGKVSGAGGGGFMMFMVPPCRRVGLIRALDRAGGLASGVHLTTGGAESWIV